METEDRQLSLISIKKFQKKKKKKRKKKEANQINWKVASNDKKRERGGFQISNSAIPQNLSRCSILPARDRENHLEKGNYTCGHFLRHHTLPSHADSINMLLVSTC